MVRVAFASLMIAMQFGTPACAADLPGTWGGPWGGAVRAEPFVVFDYEPGIEVRAHWLPPWDGRHYFPSGGKMPVLGRHEQPTATPVSEKRSFRREWSSFPVDTIQQPPLILNQQQYFPSSEAMPPPVLK